LIEDLVKRCVRDPTINRTHVIAGSRCARPKLRVPETEMADTAAPEPKPHTLDDLMIAMDVVDTIRHREHLVHRELNDAAREAELIERLREIYRQQGIPVTDKMLEDGVRALKESRFVYKPPPASWKRTAFEAWATRKRWGAWAAVALTLLIGSCGYHYMSVTLPARHAEEQARIEVAETLPKAIRQAHADIGKLAMDGTAKARADQILADGERAIRDKDRAGLTRASADLKRLQAEVASEYTLTIVSRPGETTGVWRRPPRGATQRNYYIIVEAIAPDGRKLRLPVRNEETGETHEVDKFGVRVPQATFDAVAADKRDDGIVQKNRFGNKRRGTLAVDYQMPFEGGTITKW
jgi:hypothetical protein